MKSGDFYIMPAKYEGPTIPFGVAVLSQVHGSPNVPHCSCMTATECLPEAHVRCTLTLEVSRARW